MTSVNVLMVSGMREYDTKDIPEGQGSTGVMECEPDGERAHVKVNFMEDGSSELFYKEDVNERVRELNEGKKALRSHRIEGKTVLMVVQTVPMKYGNHGAITEAVTFFNTGAPCSVIRNQFAEEHKLHGKEVVITRQGLRSGQHHWEPASRQLWTNQERI